MIFITLLLVVIILHKKGENHTQLSMHDTEAGEGTERQGRAQRGRGRAQSGREGTERQGRAQRGTERQGGHREAGGGNKKVGEGTERQGESIKRQGRGGA